jgi:hypothetical protein
VQPPKPKVPDPVIKLTENPQAPAVPPPPKEAPKPQDKEISKDLRRALDRARRLAAAAERSRRDRPTGSVTGNSSEAVSGDDYFSQVNEAIHQNWNHPLRAAQRGPAGRVEHRAAGQDTSSTAACA